MNKYITIKIFSCFLIIFIHHNKLFAQDSLLEKNINIVSKFDSAKILESTIEFPKYSDAEIKKRSKIVAISQTGFYGLSMIGLYATWYKNYPQSSFHTINDIPEWKGVDKIGHTYSAYVESVVGMQLWQWAGVEKKKKLLYGGLTGAIYQTVIEILDGFSAEWGWSFGDIAANIAGSGLAIGQEIVWDEQRLQLKFSFHKKKYVDQSLSKRSNEIFGKSLPERILKDYNGQTYWISANIKSFLPNSKILNWLQISLGSGAEGLFGANKNFDTDKNGNIIFNRLEIKRYRQWYLAPDIDLTKIRTKKKSIKIALQILNSLKFPTPAISYGNKKLKMNWIQF